MTLPNFSSEQTFPADLPVFEAAYKKVLAELTGLRPDELVPVRTDIPSAIATILGVLPRILEFIPRIVDELPRFDVTPLSKLEDYAWATSHAHILYIRALRREDELRRLADEGARLRSTLLGDALTLIRRGLLPESCLQALKRISGFKNLAIDLQLLAVILRGNLERLDGKCATTLNDLHRADAIAAEILRSAGTRKKPSASLKAARDMRNRAFTCLHEAYDDARRAIGYLCWKKGDAQSIAPSLYTGRGGRGKGLPEAVVTPAPATPATNAGTPIAAVPSSPTPSAQDAVGGPFMANPT